MGKDKWQKRGGKRKSRLTDPLEDLHALMVESNEAHLKGLLRGASVWIAVGEALARRFYACCLGRRMPGDAGLFQSLGFPEARMQELALGAPLWTIRLNLEEAFFLVYCLECLSVCRRAAVADEGVIDGKGGSRSAPAVAMDAAECWTRFVAAKPSFIQCYISFQHFRAQGWIVRSGIYYGCNYVLYRHHPSRAHAHHCVLVKGCEDELRYGHHSTRICTHARTGTPYRYAPPPPCACDGEDPFDSALPTLTTHALT